ncbi:MAG: 2-amino-4-hydroxy-6-hydroxymethyldihydropteridine diphosphokinase [Cyanobacteria bacterium P01_D01_bin.105]
MLGQKISLVRAELGQQSCRQKSSVQAAIALGGNLGNSQRILSDAIEVMDAVQGITVLAQSPFYRTAPIGPPQPDYINACITVSTVLSARELLSQLLEIENRFGRVRKVRWGARSLDLDLLLYGDRIIEVPKLSVPHPRLHERPFVLIPLMDVAAQWSHPVLNKTVEQLFAQLAQQGSLTGVELMVCDSQNSAESDNCSPSNCRFPNDVGAVVTPGKLVSPHLNPKVENQGNPPSQFVS